MVRSLYSAISGLRNHQVRLDVIGNNIANVNTTGYKSGRVTFEESMSQLLKGASRPPGFQGGTNPIQVGLGMSIGSIDTITTQGNLESTGQITDLAIEGNSYFVVSNGSGNYFTRNGAFQFDSIGKMVLPTNGFILQGKMAAEDGTFPVGTTVGDIRIPFSQQSPANATSYVQYEGNLDSDSEALGTVLYSQSFYHRANEFNTNAIASTGVGGDNDFGTYDPVGGPSATGDAAHSAGTLAITDIASDTGVLNSVKLTGVHNGSGNSLGIKTGDLLTVSATIPDATNVDETYTATFEVIDTPAEAEQVSATEYRVSTLAQLLLSVQEFLSSGPWNGGAGSSTTASVAVLSDGKVRVENTGAADIKNLTFSSNRPISKTYVSNTFSFNSTIATGDYGDTPDVLLRPALANDNLYDYQLYQDAAGSWAPISSNTTPQIYSSTGELIDVEDTDALNLSAMIGDNPKNAETLQIDTGTPGTLHDATTMQNILDYIRNTLNLPEYDGTIANNLSVSMNAVGTDDDLIPEGAVVVRGQAETAFSINNFSLLAENADPSSNAPTNFNANFVVTQLQAARDTGVYDTSIEVFDESGQAHNLTMTFTHTGIKNPGTWNWEVSSAHGETILNGRTGRMTFGLDGSPSSFIFDEAGVSTIRLDPGNGARIVEASINWGAPGSFQGITQFASSTTVAATKQDGYTSGRLEEIGIDEFGVISGSFTNGVSKALAQILTADFRNAGGLLKKGDSVYQESSNSGNAVLGIPGISSSGTIKPGALELSNVELSTEFTNMITTQRGFQANARVITTSDSMLQELVGLVR